jgi:phosphatidylglycerol:prolipoprotein diacylglycerol transferase
VRPVLLYLPFGVPVYGYGFMLSVAMFSGWFLALRLAERDGIGRGRIRGSFTWTIAGVLIGARLLYVATNPGRIASAIDAAAFWEGGMVAYGGFLGGFAGSALFCRRTQLSLMAWGDCAAPSLGLGVALTRIGCLLAGCDFGAPWHGPWSVRFPIGSPAFRQQQIEGLLPAGATASLPVHPTQLYESAAGLALLALALWVRRCRRTPGEALLAFVTGYGVLRGLIEVFRADVDRGGIGVLSTSQLIALLTFGLGLFGFHVLRSDRRGTRTVSGAR